jgi:hypothetical protein
MPQKKVVKKTASKSSPKVTVKAPVATAKKEVKKGPPKIDRAALLAAALQFEGKGGSGGGSSNFWKFSDYGKQHIVRVLPPVGDDDTRIWLPYVYHQHKREGSILAQAFDYQGRKRMLTCSAEHDPTTECLGCKVQEATKGQPNGVTRRVQYFLNIVLQDDKKNPEVLVWGAPETVITQLNELIKNDEYGPEIFDLNAGRNLIVSRAKPASGGVVTYNVLPSSKSTIIPLEMYEQAKDLTELISTYTTEEQTEILTAAFGEEVVEWI